MEFDALTRRFDLIESVGVLHHMEDPLAGWQKLAALLRPKGRMNIGLYSETARQHIVEARSMIAEKGYTGAADDIRQCREDILEMARYGNRSMAEICLIGDFYSLSTCRDLLFHVQEHRFTLLEIEKALQMLGLVFLDFVMKNEVREKFRQMYSSRESLASLTLWHAFELTNPDTFLGMYQFWCRKA